MMWVILALLGVLFWAVSNILDKVLRTKFLQDSLALIAGFGIFNVVVSFILFLFVGVPSLPLWNFIAALIAGLMLILISYPYLKALSIEEASRVVPLWHLAPLFTLILAVIFLNEILVPLRYLAFTFLLLGGVLISTRKIGSVFHMSPAVGFMLISSFMASVSEVLLKFAYSSNQFWQTFLVFYIGISLGTISLFLSANIRKRFTLGIRSKKIIFFSMLFSADLLGFAGALFYNRAILLGPITLISVFISFQSLFVLILATFLSKKYPMFIKEAIDAKTIGIKLAAIALMGIGLYLLTI